MIVQTLRFKDGTGKTLFDWEVYFNSDTGEIRSQIFTKPKPEQMEMFKRMLAHYQKNRSMLERALDQDIVSLVGFLW